MNDFWVDLARDLRLDLLGSLATAIVLGAAVGLERELRGKAAGLRTNVLICVGSTLFTWLSIEIAGPYGDPGRIAAQIVTGVGFIGAGTILHARGHISGLTSAATIWLVAAIGVAVGAGAVLEAAGATFFVLVVLGLLRPLERYLTSYGGIVRVTVEVEPRPEAVTDIERIVRETGLEGLHDQAKLKLLRTSGALTISVEE
jgi:putative Mg2+ transporter-C (MgtC) family protein